MEERYDEILLKEKEKIKYLMSLNEMLNKRVEEFNKLQEELLTKTEIIK